jgi:hypothetical protein
MSLISPSVVLHQGVVADRDDVIAGTHLLDAIPPVEHDAIAQHREKATKYPGSVE